MNNVRRLRNILQICPLSLFFLTGLFVFSCQPVKEITIEVLFPSQIVFPSYIENVAFTNRSYAPFLITNPADTFERPANELFIIDTIFGNKLFLGLFDALNNSPLFDIGYPTVMQLRRNDSVCLPEALSETKLCAICDTADVDALFSFEGYDIKDTLVYWYTEEAGDYTVILQLMGKICWRIYDAVETSIIDEYVITDTMEWVVFIPFLSGAVDQLPELVDAYREFSYQNGYNYGERISPTWKKAKRFYYRNGNSDLKKAAKLAEKEDWQEAFKLWEKTCDSSNNSSAARAAFNLALYYEINDSLATAVDWGKKAYQLYPEDYSKKYIEILEKRKKDNEVLRYQLPME